MTEFEETGIIEQVRAIKRITDKMDDASVDKALAIIIELIKKPEVPSSDVKVAITRLEALAAYFGAEASWYKGWGKGGLEERYRKDMYYTLRESFQRLADAVKYQAKVHGQIGSNQ